MSNREVYPDWHVKRTERLPSKINGAKAESDGMREYSYFECVHCNGDVGILSEHLKKNKKSTIDAHLTVCPSFTGERPSKRSNTTAEKIQELERELEASNDMLAKSMQMNHKLKELLETCDISWRERCEVREEQARLRAHLGRQGSDGCPNKTAGSEACVM